MNNTQQEAQSHELLPRYDSRASFYGKARVEVDADGTKRLWSYSTHVASVKDGKPMVFGWYSTTTGRHIKEFLLQNGFEAENKKQILATYGESALMHQEA